MYAVIRSGGKQYKVTPGECVRLDKIVADKGATIQLEDVLAIHDGSDLTVGSPTLASATVTATVVNHGRGEKVIVYRFKRRKGFHKKKGHRQDFTEVRIDNITA